MHMESQQQNHPIQNYILHSILEIRCVASKDQPLVPIVGSEIN